MSEIGGILRTIEKNAQVRSDLHPDLHTLGLKIIAQEKRGILSFWFGLGVSRQCRQRARCWKGVDDALEARLNQ